MYSYFLIETVDVNSELFPKNRKLTSIQKTNIMCFISSIKFQKNNKNLKKIVMNKAIVLLTESQT